MRESDQVSRQSSACSAVVSGLGRRFDETQTQLPGPARGAPGEGVALFEADDGHADGGENGEATGQAVGVLGVA